MVDYAQREAPPAEPMAETHTGRALRTPRSAAVAGIAFSLLFTASLLLVRSVVPSDPNDAGQWLSDTSHRDAVLLALALVPFAGIAFLWFVGVLRDRIGDAEDRFFGTVFLGSALLFVAMIFCASAVAAGLVAGGGDAAGTLKSSGAWDFGRQATHELMVVYAMRMAAVFMLASSTILMRLTLAPRWLVFGGYAVAAVLLLTVGSFPWIELAFPAWVLVLSGYILVVGWRQARTADYQATTR